MALVESSLNVALAAVLNRMSRQWEVTAELTGRIQGNTSLRIDIMIEGDNRSPIVVENEYLPGSTVESDALGRLGKTLTSDGSLITESVALRSPANLKECTTVEQAENVIQSSQFEYALYRYTYSGSGTPIGSTAIQRIPESSGSFLRGSVFDLANFLANASLSTYALQRSIEELDRGVQDSIGILRGIADSNDQLKEHLSNLLMQAFADSDITQGLGVAVTVVVNASLFQQKLARQYPEVLSLAQMKGKGYLHQAGLLEQWQEILKINYWPIYSIAASVLQTIDDPYVAQRFIDRLFHTTQSLIELGVVETHDLCGVVFQRFMTERKYLASFYTRPESATLLSHLAVPDLDWSDKNVYEGFKFADYSCGTGTLVHSVYRRIAYLHEFKGGDPQASHSLMMEQNITAADIVPSAAHLTATLLSSVFPEKTYGNSRVVVPQYGAVDDAKMVSLGSLELLDGEGIFRLLFPQSAEMKVIGGEHMAHVAPELLVQEKSQDLVIMNPPYTRAMSDWIDDAYGTWKPFNVLGNSKETQQRMRERERDLTSRISCYNGYQSMPSAFCGIADLMLKDGGIFAFVLPITSLQGVSWRKFRLLLAEQYINVTAVSITGQSADDCSWSADTSLAEVLIIAQKRTTNQRRESSDIRGTLINLHERPTNSMIATEFAQEINRHVQESHLRSIEDGPWGGTPLQVGSESVGELLSVPTSESTWQALGIRDLTLAQTAYQLSRGEIWLPGMDVPIQHNLSIQPIARFAKVGFADNNIANNNAAAFQRLAVSASPTYPMVWRNRSKEQRKLLLHPDQEGRVKPGKEALASRIWELKSHALVAREVSFHSQSLVAGFAKQPVIGGRAWPNIQLADELQERVFVLWGNTTLGALSFWYQSGRQQVKRGMVTVTGIKQLPWLDPTQLSGRLLSEASELFDEFVDREFLPIGQSCNDHVRQELDEQLLIEILGLPKQIVDSLNLVREKLCNEPSMK